MTKFYVDSSGAYIGGYCDCDCEVEGAVEVASAPPCATCVWDSQAEEWTWPLDCAKELKLAEINDAAQAALEQISSPYQSGERESWETQRDEANAYLLDSEADTPFIDGMIAAQGMTRTKAQLAADIVANADEYTGCTASIVGQRVALCDLVRAC